MPPRSSSKALTVQAYPGDGNFLLAFDVDAGKTAGLAGFAIEGTTPSGKSFVLPNRLNFADAPKASPTDRALTPSTAAPIQKFRWLDVLGTPELGTYQYQVTAMYFDRGTKLKAGAKATVTVQRKKSLAANFDLGFTRGYLSSQAYAEKFKNAPVSPTPFTVDYATAPFEARYAWLGFHARRQIFDFLAVAASSPTYAMDVFAYDIDEPDIVRALVKLGSRLRIVLDNSASHVSTNAPELTVLQKLTASAGAANVHTGHFSRFAHDKIFVLKKNDKPVKVLTGSANFSVRGLYVQANNVMVVSDPAVAALYESVFEQVFTGMSGFKKSPLAAKWWDIKAKGLPALSFSFAPHASSAVSLDRVSTAIANAKGSVLFAIMDLSGGGPVLKSLAARPASSVFSYGMTQRTSGVDVANPNDNLHRLVSFDYLNSQVPPPFQQETSGGQGIVIHHKFVVIDFNGAKPVVYAGSSNLAAGGEEENGDNLLEISDRAVATTYAVEALRLIDHFHFRHSLKTATPAKPLVLSTGDWWQPYYVAKSLKATDRQIFAMTTPK